MKFTTTPIREAAARDPLMRVLMIGVTEDGRVSGEFIDDTRDGRRSADEALAAGEFEAVILAKPFEIRRRRP